MSEDEAFSASIILYDAQRSNRRPWSILNAHAARKPQISRAYSATVRSLENLPLRATFKIAFSAHAVGLQEIAAHAFLGREV